MKGVKKQHLPQKICLVCQRTFSWRKKWEKNWEHVNYWVLPLIKWVKI